MVKTADQKETEAREGMMTRMSEPRGMWPGSWEEAVSKREAEKGHSYVARQPRAMSHFW